MKRETDQGIGRWKVEGGGGTESIWWHSSATWVGPPPSSSSSPLLSSKSQKTDGLGISQIRSQTNAFFLCLSLFGHTKHCYSMPTMEWKLYLFIFWLILIWCANKTQLSLSLSLSLSTKWVKYLLFLDNNG